MLRLGFVGVGALVTAVIDGLQSTHGDRCQILVSPRSETASRALAQRYPNVARAQSNAAVVEGSDVVFLGMRPNQIDNAVAGLPFRPDQTVVSFLAGVPHELVSERVRPATHVVRINPLPPIRLRKGPVVMYPANRIVEELFSGLGDLVVAGKESDLAAIANCSAMMSSHYALQNRLVDWLISREMAPETATLYVRSMFSGLAAVGLDALSRGEAVDPAHHETKGGLNERGRRYLTEIGWFDEVGRALDLIENHVLMAR